VRQPGLVLSKPYPKSRSPSLHLPVPSKKLSLSQPPAPLWNAQKKAAYEAERRKGSATANQPARANGTQENIDPASSNRTTRAAPLAGTHDPFGGPSGAGFPSAQGN